MNIAAVKHRHPELMEAVYAIKPFWGWKQALEAAGIEYSDIKVELQDYCECEICHVWRRTLAPHLKHKHGIDIDDYRIDYPDAEVVCEEIRARCSRMKCEDLPHWERLWTAEYILDRLWQRHEKGLPVNLYAVSLNDYNILSHIRLHFDTFDNAIKNLGLKPKDIRRISVPLRTKKEVLDAIARLRRLHLPLNSTAINSGKYAAAGLYMGAKRVFGSWKKAIEAAGLDYEEIRKGPKYPTRASVLREIKHRYRLGLPVTASKVAKGEQADHALVRSGRKFIGKWGKILSKLHIRRRDFIQPRWKYPTTESVIAEIQRRQKTGLSIRVADVKKAYSDLTLYKSARRYFGQWDRAVERAGFSYRELAPRRTRYPTLQAVLDEIRNRYQKRLPLNTSGISKGDLNDYSLYRTGKKMFGTWKCALLAAGIRYKDIAPVPCRKYPTKESVIAEIKRRRKDRLPIRAIDVAKGPHSNSALYVSAIKYFKRWARLMKYVSDPYGDETVTRRPGK